MVGDAQKLEISPADYKELCSGEEAIDEASDEKPEEDKEKIEEVAPEETKAEEKVDMQRKAKSNKHLKWGLIIWFSTVPLALNSLFNGWDRVGRNNLTQEPVRQAKATPTTTDIEKDGKTLL